MFPSCHHGPTKCLQAATQRTIRALLRGHCWYDYLGVHKLKPWMQPHGAVWEIREVLGMPIVDGSYCVTLRWDHCSGLHQPIYTISLPFYCKHDAHSTSADVVIMCHTEMWTLVCTFPIKVTAKSASPLKHHQIRLRYGGWKTLAEVCLMQTQSKCVFGV